MSNDSLEKTWRARYDRWAELYATDHLVSGWSERGLYRRLELFLQALEDSRFNQGSRFLDLGSGPGVYTRSIKRSGHGCVALDYSHRVVELASKKDPSGHYVQGEAYSLPFKDGSFDGLVCIGVLQSLANVDVALTEMCRVLAPGGCLFLDGLSRLFLIHALKALKERMSGAVRRMSYYDPFRLTATLRNIGFDEAEIRWLVMPEALQPYGSLLRRKRALPLTRLFGYSFMISARKIA